MHFILYYKTLDASHIASIFFHVMVHLHKLLKLIMSDYDVIYELSLEKIMKKFGTKSLIFTLYHPQTYHQIEVINKSLGDLGA